MFEGAKNSCPSSQGVCERYSSGFFHPAKSSVYPRGHTLRNVKKCAGHLDRQVLPFAGPNANLPVLACFLFTVLRNCAFFLPDIWTGRSSAPAGPNANLPVRTGGPAHFAMYAIEPILCDLWHFEKLNFHVFQMSYTINSL